MPLKIPKYFSKYHCSTWCQTTLDVYLQACTLVFFFFFSNFDVMSYASIPKGDLTLNGGMFQQPPFPLPPLSKT